MDKVGVIFNINKTTLLLSLTAKEDFVNFMSGSQKINEFELKNFSKDNENILITKNVKDLIFGEINKKISKIELLFIIVNNISKEVVYLIETALKYNISTLVILESKNLNSINKIKNNKFFGKKIFIDLREGDYLNNIILKFIDNLKVIKGDSLFNIKYTLRVSKKINSYLNWKAQALQTKKADWLRAEIEKMMKQDEAYQNFVKNKYKNN
jgi:hypothetical protein